MPNNNKSKFIWLKKMILKFQLNQLVDNLACVLMKDVASCDKLGVGACNL